MRMAHIGKHMPVAVKIKMSMVKKGKVPYVMTEQTKAKIRLARKNQVISEDTKKLLSRIVRERLANPEYCQRIREIKSRKMKEYWSYPLNRKKQIALIKKNILRGKDAPNWRGGISFEPYAGDFNSKLKEEIRDRDNHKCQLCDMPESENKKSLTIHHIDYDKNNSQNNNLIALCVGCNSKVNVNREYWSDYFRQILAQRIGVNG